MQFTIIGIDDNQKQEFKEEVSNIILDSQVFSGGKRHYEIVKPYLPQNHTWIEIRVPLDDVFKDYEQHKQIVVFASGDPFFFGFGNTIQRYLPNANIKLFSHFNSLQQLAHKILLPYQNMHIVSLTGRPWNCFDEALIKSYDLIGVLTDRKLHTPATIAARMIKYGFTNYKMTVGELLGNSEKEKHTSLDIQEVAGKNFAFPNNIILQKIKTLDRKFGINDSEFNLLNGRSKMITKMPIRMLSLNMLDLRYKKTFWDIGFCTGSVSIEAKTQFPHLQIISFEKREEGKELMEKNTAKFHTPGIQAIISDFTQIDLSPYTPPEAIFIGGHGGKMQEMFQKFAPLLSDDGCVVFNSVSKSSYNLFFESVKQTRMKIVENTAITVDNFNTIHILKAVKSNKNRL